MKIVSLTGNNQIEIIVEAVEILKKGGSIVYPTDTVYGLGVNPFDDFAVRRLYRIKKRPQDKPIPLIVKNIAMAKKLAYVNAQQEKMLRALWPGAVTAVFSKRRLVPAEISARTKTVALRIPAHNFCMALLSFFNSPVTSTSANISGENHTNDPKFLISRFTREFYKPDLVIDAGVLSASAPSTVLDLTKPRPKVLRVGPVRSSDLAQILSF